jgi:hypothetical protein
VDVWIYFQRKEVEFRRFGLVPERERYDADPNSDGTEGLVEVILPLTNNAYLKVYELVEVVDRRYIRRFQYAYVLIIDRAHAHSWELDPTHYEMPVHEHVGPLRVRREAQPVSFKQALLVCWKLVSSR